MSSVELIGIKMGLSISKSTALVIFLTFQCLNVLAQDMATTEAALNRLNNESRDWIQSSCPRSLGPSLWLNCVNREIAAVRDKSTQYESMSSEHLAWIEQSCPRSLGPSLYKNCAERETFAIKSGIPQISQLPKRERDWIALSCPKSLGPSLYKNCVVREGRAMGVNLN